MSFQSEGQYPKIVAQQLQGLNEREQYANPNVNEFDLLQGLIPVHKNTLTRAPGCKLYLDFGEPILGIHQTNDSRGNVIIQTLDNVYVVTENDLFGIEYDPGLVFSADPTGLFMAYAKLVHKAALNVDGGSIGAAWATREITDIVSQINNDGTAATFLTLAANQFTLSSGVYVIQGVFTVSSNVTDGVAKKARVRLQNITAGLPAWDGLPNEEGDSVFIKDYKGNVICSLGGHLVLAGPTILEVQDIRDGAGTIRGNAANLGSFEIYGQLDVWKLA